jgi:hypothetical protein
MALATVDQSSIRGLVKRERSPSSAISVAALTSAMPRIVCSARHDGGQIPVRQHRLDLRRQPIAPYLGNFDRRDVIFEHDVMDRLVELETRQPAAMQLGPGRSAIVASLAQQKPAELD